MAYFDQAATTYPKPECVYDAMDTFYRRVGGSVGRGDYRSATSAKEMADETRKTLKALLHCENKEVIFTPTDTIALNMIIQGLIRSGAKIIYITPFEHNAVTRILHSYETQGLIKVNQLKVSTLLSYDLERIRYQFEEEKPDLVIASHASNVIGLVAPVDGIFALAKGMGATTVLDMAQTAGLVDCHVGKEIYDFVVFAGHKTLLGPTGISGFLMKPEFDLPPVLFGGTGFDSANQNMPDSLPERFEMGTLNVPGIAGLHASLMWILQIGVEKLYEEECQKREALLRILSEFDFLSLVGTVPERKYVGIVSCVLDGISSDTAGQLFNERNVAVRTGLHCAPLAHRFLGTFPAGTIRFSVNYFTTEEDFAVLKSALMDIGEGM